MTLNAQYDADNIFAKIVRGEMSAVKIHEDDATLAFMDLFPQSEGHALVISKKATAANFFDIDESDLQTLIVSVQKVARAVKDALSPDGVRIIQFNGAPAGQTVFHLHFHIIPVYEGAGEKPHAGGGQMGNQADANVLEALAARIRAHL